MRTLKLVLVAAFWLGTIIFLTSGRITLNISALANDQSNQSHRTKQNSNAIRGTAEYVGNNSCAECHGEKSKSYLLTAHGKAKISGANIDSVSCESCHGGAKTHVEYYTTAQNLAKEGKDDEAQALYADEAKSSAARLITFDKLSPAEVNRNCMQCHAQMKEHTNWRGSKHESAGLSCLSCHSAHHSPVVQMTESKFFATAQAEVKLLKMRTEADTCFQCHADVRKAQFQRSTHLFRNENREHQINCSSCHEPHGSIGEKMMRTASVNETCYQCHTEKRGPFLFEHSPVRESCANCHKAHGSNNTALLVSRAPMLCQQCHIQGRHQTIAGRPNSAFAFNRACVTCHAQIHGSNHPSGINLQR